MRIVVGGWVAGFPTAGFFWHAVSFALGFRELGHEVWFLDDSGDEPYCWDLIAGVEDPTGRAGSRFLAGELERLGLGDRWVYRHVPTGRHDGLSADDTDEMLADADLFVNVSLTIPPRAEYRRIPHRIGIDTDPVFTQVRIARGDTLLSAVPEWHTRLFTFGRPPLPAQRPDDEWLPTRQPVVTARWPVASPPPPSAPFTTLTTWQAYPPVEWEGRQYAAKDVSIRQLIDLPSLTDVPLAVALGGGSRHHEGVRALSTHGWRILDPTEASLTTPAYQRFLGASAGEIGIAKHGYVSARSGWFSERTCLYLASGRPAVVQDTGWTDWLPSGSGLLAYSTPEQAAQAITSVMSDYARHAEEARRLCEEHFEARVVCAELLDAL